jgi:hypothetical protein
MRLKKSSPSLNSSSDLSQKIEAALQLAVADAIEEHRRSGHPLAIWQDGRVVMLPPDQAVVPPAKRRRTRKNPTQRDERRP